MGAKSCITIALNYIIISKVVTHKAPNLQDKLNCGSALRSVYFIFHKCVHGQQRKVAPDMKWTLGVFAKNISFWSDAV